MLTLVTLLAGCSNNASTELSQDIVADTNSAQKEMTSENENSAENKAQNDKKNVLIAYFSRIGNIDSEHDVDAVSSASVITQGNDLAGKKIYLFNSSGGGGARNAYSEVSDLEPDAEVEKNIFSVSHSQASELTEQDMLEWLSQIGYDT